ncbi:hypothetical protein [Weissella coleopterorum]|uniref:hypothetical protein n=1 Tax=Weissella coleopterorum TaxID=2714949 RepID=UPI001FE6753C|nr:hypothetical protein [Weissella coleopterorum]
MKKIWKNIFNRNSGNDELEDSESVFEQLKRYSGDDLKKPLTRAENRLTHKGKFEINPQTRKLTPAGKTDRLKYRLNWTIFWLILGSIVTWLILFLL